MHFLDHKQCKTKVWTTPSLTDDEDVILGQYQWHNTLSLLTKEPAPGKCYEQDNYVLYFIFQNYECTNFR